MRSIRMVLSMIDPNMVQRINAHFHASGGTFSVEMNSDPSMNAKFGTVYVKDDSKVLYATTETWNNQPGLIAQAGYIYIYSDWRKDDENRTIAGLKVGDGVSYLIDIPFTTEDFVEHMSDQVCHITQAEREFWNNKVRCYMTTINEDGQLVFTTN